jgi:hypothetical protein
MANAATVELVIADAENLALAALLAPQWGIYYQGIPVIQPATLATQVITGALGGFAALPGAQQISAALGINIVPVTASMVNFEYKQDWPISNYPQEQGAFQSYDKVTLPFDVRLKLACGGPTATRQAFLTTAFAIAGGAAPGAPLVLSGSGAPPNNTALFDIVTPERTYTSCSCTHIEFSRAAQNGATIIIADMFFQQISVTSTTNFANTQQPGNAGQVGIGNQQPQTPSPALESTLASGLY